MANPTNAPDIPGERIRRAAVELAPKPVKAIELAGAGANSAVYRLRCEGADYALKCYAATVRDAETRPRVEWQTLKFLFENGVEEAPKPIARSVAEGCLLMEWIEGSPLGRHGAADIEQAIGFMTRIFALSNKPEAAAFAPAAEACFSGAAIVQQIERRLEALNRDAQLGRFLDEEFWPLFRELRETVLQSPWGGDLPSEHRRLIPADFGFHNALRARDGRLRYFDFDYFGWDDPVKLAADFILHPAMSVTPEEGRQVAAAFAAALPDDAQFLRRLDALLPLYALRWSVILLNPYRADRQPADTADPEARQRLLSLQLQKAQRMLERAAGAAGPYGDSAAL